MYNKINILFCCFLVLSISACNNDDPVGQHLVFDIEEEFTLQLIEELTPENDRNLILEVASIREFDCENFGIETEATLFGTDRIRLSVADLIVPDQCQGGKAPAAGEAPIDNLSANTYQLNVTLANQIENEGTLYANSDYYQIEINQENGITLPYPIVRKVPQQVIWGYVGYADSDFAIADELMTDMLQFLEFGNFTAGHYGHFNIAEDGTLTLPKENILSPKFQIFLFNTTISSQELQKKVEETYCPLYQAKIDLKLFTADGMVIECP